MKYIKETFTHEEISKMEAVHLCHAHGDDVVEYYQYRYKITGVDTADVTGILNFLSEYFHGASYPLSSAFLSKIFGLVEDKTQPASTRDDALWFTVKFEWSTDGSTWTTQDEINHNITKTGSSVVYIRNLYVWDRTTQSYISLYKMPEYISDSIKVEFA